MSKIKITTVVGARPQFIKASMLSAALDKNANFSEKIVHTGQHYDENMSKVFFNEMGIPDPDYSLGIGSLSHGAMTGRQLEQIEKVLIDDRPDYVLVYGDTNSTLAGSLAASKLGIPIIHVEAGLRSFNKSMPEEINRVLTDHIADILFTPTQVAVKNLLNEGISQDKIFNVGDIMFDATLHFTQKAEKHSNILNKLILESKKYLLCTIHRQENTDDVKKLKNIFDALSASNESIVIPMHPRTKNIINDNNFNLNDNIRIVDPVGYLDMLILEKNASKIITDSGGVQKEAFFQRVPCITLRDETEWLELVDYGANQLVGSNYNLILKSINKTIQNITNEQFYGDGSSANQIIRILEGI